MPFFKIETSQQINTSEIQSISEKSSKMIAKMLEKPEQYVMISIETGKSMMFGGIAEPTAFVQLKSIGLPVEKCADFSNQICQFLNDEFGIQANRVFIDFKNIEGNMFGWDGKTF